VLAVKLIPLHIAERVQGLWVDPYGIGPNFRSVVIKEALDGDEGAGYVA